MATLEEGKSTAQVLLLAPSRGLGGGIERYVLGLEWAFATQGVVYERVDLCQPGLVGHLRLAAQSAARLRAVGQPVRAVVAHRALLPVASFLAWKGLVHGISVICHGSEVWGPRLRPRWYAERQLMRRGDVRVVGVSGFTAGTLFSASPAIILPPGLSQDWFDELARAAAVERAPQAGVRLLTAFRLDDWRDKGLPELLTAVASLGRSDIFLAVCGSGEASTDLLRLVRPYPWCTLHVGLSDRVLADQLAAADLFVLATRTRPGRQACGEGFGLVLLEAQVAGTPVVAPAYGGSTDAYLNGVTGFAPADESVAALSELLEKLLKDPAGLVEMGTRATAWARECFAPERYAPLTVERLL